MASFTPTEPQTSCFQLNISTHPLTVWIFIINIEISFHFLFLWISLFPVMRFKFIQLIISKYEQHLLVNFWHGYFFIIPYIYQIIFFIFVTCNTFHLIFFWKIRVNTNSDDFKKLLEIVFFFFSLFKFQNLIQTKSFSFYLFLS